MSAISNTKLRQLFDKLFLVNDSLLRVSDSIQTIVDDIYMAHDSLGSLSSYASSEERHRIGELKFNCPILRNPILADSAVFPQILHSASYNNAFISLRSMVSMPRHPSGRGSEIITEESSVLQLALSKSLRAMNLEIVRRSKFSNFILFKSYNVEGRTITNFKNPLDNVLNNKIYRSLSNIVNNLDRVYDVVSSPRSDIRRSVIGFIKGKSYIQHATAHLGCKSMVTMDITKFYNSINLFDIVDSDLSDIVFLGFAEDFLGVAPSAESFGSEILFSRFMDCIKYLSALFIFNMSFLTYKGILPTGMGYSPVVSNLMLYSLDRSILSTLNDIRHPFRYTRYADDIAISSESCVADDGSYAIDIDLVRKIEKLVRFHKFHLNYDKTAIMGSKDRKIVSGILLDSSGAVPIMSIGRAKKKSLGRKYNGKAWSDLTPSELGTINWVRTINKGQHRYILKGVSGVPDNILE